MLAAHTAAAAGGSDSSVDAALELKMFAEDDEVEEAEDPDREYAPNEHRGPVRYASYEGAVATFGQLSRGVR